MRAGVCDIERIRRFGEDRAPIRRVVCVYAIDALKLGVGDTKQVGLIKDGQSVGKSEIPIQEDASISAVHIGDFDLRRLPIPIRPEDPAVGRIGDNASRIHQLRVDDHAPFGPVQFGHFHAVQLRVGPVDVARDPVDGEAFGRPQTRGNDRPHVLTIVVGL